MVEPELFPEGAPRAEQQPPPRRNVGMPPQELQRLNEHVNQVASRLAVLEERGGNLRKKSQLTEQSLIEYEKDTKVDLRALTQTLTELASRIEEVKEQVDAIGGELSNVVQRHEFTVLERYLDLWEPMQFMTRAEAKLLLKEGKKQA